MLYHPSWQKVLWCALSAHADTQKPFLISNQIIFNYSHNHIDTLHMKNLLHWIGEDRYTPFLKYFLMYKTQFIQVAMQRQLLWMTGRFSFHNVVGGSIRQSTSLATLCSWINFAVSVVSPCGLLSWWILCRHSLSLSPLHMYGNSFARELDYLMHLQIGYLIVFIMYEHKTALNHSIGSWAPPAQFCNDSYVESCTASLYGLETYYKPRSQSPVPSQLGVLPPGYQSGCNVPLLVGHMWPMSDKGLLPQSGLSRPTTYIGMLIPLTQEMDLTSGTPSDVDLKHTVLGTLQTANLNTVTKCEAASSRSTLALTSCTAMINATINCTLLGQSWYACAFICLDSITWTRHYGCTLVCGPNCL